MGLAELDDDDWITSAAAAEYFDVDPKRVDPDKFTKAMCDLGYWEPVKTSACDAALMKLAESKEICTIMGVRIKQVRQTTITQINAGVLRATGRG